MARFQKTLCGEKVEDIGTSRIVARARAQIAAGTPLIDKRVVDRLIEMKKPIRTAKIARCGALKFTPAARHRRITSPVDQNPTLYSTAALFRSRERAGIGQGPLPRLRGVFAECGTISGGEAAELVKAEAACDCGDGGCRAVLRCKRAPDFAQSQRVQIAHRRNAEYGLARPPELTWFNTDGAT
jgi:hypothetical protein